MNTTGDIRSCEVVKEKVASMRNIGVVQWSEKCIDENNKEREIICKNGVSLHNYEVSCSYEGELSTISILAIILVAILICGPFIALIINIIRKKFFKKRNSSDYYNNSSNYNSNGNNDDDDNILPEYTEVNIHSISNESNSITHLPTYEEAMANSSGNNCQS